MEVNQPLDYVKERHRKFLQFWLEINDYQTKKNQLNVGSQLDRYFR